MTENSGPSQRTAETGPSTMRLHGLASLKPRISPSRPGCYWWGGLLMVELPSHGLSRMEETLQAFPHRVHGMATIHLVIGLLVGFAPLLHPAEPGDVFYAD